MPYRLSRQSKLYHQSSCHYANRKCSIRAAAVAPQTTTLLAAVNTADAAPWVSEVNRSVPRARQGEFAPLQIGPLSLWPPVVSAPMAGISSAPFRRLNTDHGAAMAVGEMLIASTLLQVCTNCMAA